jgi:hypothetical protein
MKTKGFVAMAFVILALVLAGGVPQELTAQGAAAISGTVSAAEEGKMEGVVVSARGADANFTVSVMTDKSGKYTIPRSHLPAGDYTLKTRAAGYDLTDPGVIKVAAGKTTKADLKLAKTKDIVNQLSSLEIINSMNGTPEQKSKIVHQLLACNYCHTYQRIVKSKHDPKSMHTVMERMIRYYADGTAISNDNRRGRAARVQEPGRQFLEKSPIWGLGELTKEQVAEYFASNNMSKGSLPYELKPAPRPKFTNVIITEWDIPTATTATHDSALDPSGNLWITDESAQYLAKFDTKTKTFKEYPMPAVPQGVIPGTCGSRCATRKGSRFLPSSIRRRRRSPGSRALAPNSSRSVRTRRCGRAGVASIPPR